VSGRRWTRETSPSSTASSRDFSIVDDRLAAVELSDGRTVPRTAVFIRPTIHAHQDGLLAKLDCEVDAGGFARVDATGQSSVPGVWLAGNATNPRAQVITAAGEGSAAAIAINADLVEEDVRNALQSTTTSGHAATASTKRNRKDLP
jgi:pyruvate/2-oxoglutarate dehydrogenase complex dihydrolipoamide dehydrogenase (E3) component